MIGWLVAIAAILCCDVLLMLLIRSTRQQKKLLQRLSAQTDSTTHMIAESARLHRINRHLSEQVILLEAILDAEEYPEGDAGETRIH